MLYGNPGPATVEPWARGDGTVLMQFTAAGLSSLGQSVHRFGTKNVSIFYGQGPVVAASSFPPNVSVLSFYRTEIHSKQTNQTNGTMVNTPAITSTQYGRGKVVLNSPHPEIPTMNGATLPEIYAAELAWALQLER